MSQDVHVVSVVVGNMSNDLDHVAYGTQYLCEALGTDVDISSVDTSGEKVLFFVRLTKDEVKKAKESENLNYVGIY